MISYGDNSVSARYIVMTRTQGGQSDYQVFDTQAGRAVGKAFKTKKAADAKARKLNGN
jgi:hypothetical protein